MLSQHDPLLSHASSSQARHISGVLTPGTDSSLNDARDGGGKKRKRDCSSLEDLLKDSFIVTPYPSNPLVKPRTLQPLLLLPRSNLPLSCLNTTTSAEPLGLSRLFEAHVKILELEERMGSQPMVLIAKLDDNRTLYAVEREDRGLFALCQLGFWVDLKRLSAAAVVARQPTPRTLDSQLLPLGSHQEGQLVPAISAESANFSKRKRLAIEAIQSMVKRPTIGLIEEPQPATAEELSTVSHAEAPDTQAPIINKEDSQPTAADIFENIRHQYFETLYLSQASLAYFAKGPLSRARAAFHLDYDCNLSMNDLVAFLESLILSSTLIDKKFRDGLTGCILLLDIHNHTADEASQVTAKSKKRRISKTMKPGKTGLYPNEDILVRQWWAGHDEDSEAGAPGMSKDERSKKRIAQLRVRETQLQMIIILEVLALQPLCVTLDDTEKNLPGALPTIEAADQKYKAAKPKKPDHLAMLIDMHIDRLCIWQSIALEGVQSAQSESRTPLEGSSANNSGSADNILRDFCVEVIAPFFSARLPDRCSAINRKLGGPIVSSPPKPKLTKSASFSHPASRPGAATKRPIPTKPKPRQSLQRVLTDERERRSLSRGPSGTSKAISLMRSATMPLGLPNLKREASEAPSLSNIPLADSQVFQANRGGVLKSKQFSRREVDLSTLARGPSLPAKVKKQATIEAELKEAISALKKPNRELAGKSQVETAEKRVALVGGSGGSARKSKELVRNPLFGAFQGVQILATPKANRQKDMLTSESQLQHVPPHFEEDELSFIPPSSLPRIPQSAFRPSHSNTLSQNPPRISCLATPTRKPAPAPSRSRLGDDLYGNAVLDSSPLQPRLNAHLFMNLPDLAAKRSEGMAVDGGVLETPIKGRG